jgi:hypothetical protein
MNSLLLAALIGTVAGLHAATWGMYKDAPHEGFSGRKYLRSPILGGVIGVLVHASSGMDPGHPATLIVLFGMIYAVERAVAEIYKTFLREEDQSKYFIPMQLHVLGRVVQSRTARLLAGSVYVTLLLGLVLAIRHLDVSGAGREFGWVALLVGSLGGWISAFGGAWKDAPSEGFQLFKFFRSPLLALLFTFGLSHLTESVLATMLAATGFTIATTETYKTFFFPSKPRGKFAGRPVVYPDMLNWRRRFVPLYVAIWIALAGSLTAALVTAYSGSTVVTVLGHE